MRLPKELRIVLSAPQGILFNDLIDAIELLKGKKVITVGDVSTRRLMELGIEPFVAIIDGKTRREVRVRLSYLKQFINVENPPGVICAEAVRAISRALREELWVMVNGEEDLLAIPALLIAKEGSALVYGQPGTGVVYLEANEKTKEYFSFLLSFFEGEGKGEIIKLLEHHEDV